MGFFNSLFGSNKPVTTNNTSTSNYDQQDNTIGAGDNSIVAARGGEVTLITNEVPDLAFLLAGDALNANAMTAIAALDSSNRGFSALEKISGDATRQLLETLDTTARVNDSAGRLVSGAVGDAFTFGSNVQRAAAGTVSDSLLAADNASRRSLEFAGSTLGDSLAAIRQSQSAAYGFADSALTGVVKLLGEASKNSANEAVASRDFASGFVGDFYESQKSGDVQTLQMLTQVGGAVVAVVAIAWLLRSKAA